jgi:hypothetical protein
MAFARFEFNRLGGMKGRGATVKVRAEIERGITESRVLEVAVVMQSGFSRDFDDKAPILTGRRRLRRSCRVHDAGLQERESRSTIHLPFGFFRTFDDP